MSRPAPPAATPTKPKAKPRWRRRLTVAAGVALLGLVSAVAVTAGWQHLREGVGAPTPEALADPWHRGQRVVARDGRVLRDRPSAVGLRGRELDLEAIGPRLRQATLSSEDREFFRHDGVDRQAILRAALQSLRHRRLVSGASTITQQLVKLVDSRGQLHQRTLGTKLREVARAQNLEETLSKPEILGAYINRLPYGHGLVGPAAAADGYFGVAPRDLSWAQAAFLAVLPRAPSYLDPYRHQERVRLRQVALLDALHAQGHLDEASHRAAVREPIVLRELRHPFLAPHLVEALIAEAATQEEKEEKEEKEEREEKIHTTLDLDLQRDLEGILRVQVAALAEQGASDAAAIVVDNHSGEVLAYIGSADFHDPAISGQVDMVRARRQPGSTLKPFVYALGLARGHRASEALADVATRFEETGGTYTPVNFGRSYDGPISLREALAGSLNIPAVRLAAELEPGELLRLLRRLGLASLDQPATHYGLALALGSGEIRLRELAAAYVTLARGGERIDLRLATDDPTTLGQAIPPGAGERIIDPAIAAQLAEILSDPLARIRGLHGRGPFVFPYPVAVKTGTSSGYRDTWAVGFTHERTVAVWLGNADGSGTANLTGASGAGRLFAALLRRVMDDVPQRAPLWDPDLLVAVDRCPLSGAAPGPACPETVRRLERRRDPGDAATPETPCTLHRRVHREPQALSGWRCDPRGREVAVVLGPEYEEWLLMHRHRSPGGGAEPWIAAATSPGCGASDIAPLELRIVAPAPGSVFLLDRHDGLGGRAQAIEVEIAVTPAARASELGELEVVVDGAVVGRTTWPYRQTITLSPGDHRISARPADPQRSVLATASQISVR